LSIETIKTRQTGNVGATKRVTTRKLINGAGSIKARPGDVKEAFDNESNETNSWRLCGLGETGFFPNGL
jgi:hypothetical protein